MLGEHPPLPGLAGPDLLRWRRASQPRSRAVRAAALCAMHSHSPHNTRLPRTAARCRVLPQQAAALSCASLLHEIREAVRERSLRVLAVAVLLQLRLGGGADERLEADLALRSDRGTSPQRIHTASAASNWRVAPPRRGGAGRDMHNVSRAHLQRERSRVLLQLAACSRHEARVRCRQAEAARPRLASASSGV